MSNLRLLKDKLAARAMLAMTILASLLVLAMVAGLYWKAKPILDAKSIVELLFSSTWKPLKGEFGFWAFIAGSLAVTGMAVALSVPFSLLTALYLSEYAGSRIRELAKPLIDVLAGIPSVVYGIWGVLVVVPFVKDHVAPTLGVFSTGYCVLSAGIVLAIMVLPIVIHITLEVLAAVPRGVREASLSLGATKWQTTKHVVLRKAAPGVIAAVVLGLSRAFGETMAVLMVAGNVAKTPTSLLSPAYPLPALIANNYGEMLSIPMYDAALMLASLILLMVVLVFNVLAKLILVRVQRSVA